MTILVLTNIGSRDVTHNRQNISPARSKGEELLENYSNIAKDLSFPIIQPVLTYLQNQHPHEEIHLYLFGTDQPDPAFQPTDTLYFSRLIARRLPEIMGENIKTRVVDVKVNPAYYDSTYDHYNDLLIDILKDEKNTETCYVALAGGTPACNTALLLHGVRLFGDRLQVIYTPQGGEPIPIRAGKQILDTFREAVAIERLERLDFANVLPLLEEIQCPDGIRYLVKYSAHRLDFDFRSAQKELEDAISHSDDETRNFIQSDLRHDLDALLNESQSPAKLVALLRELNWNAAICWQHRRYADFLARVYRFQEAVLRYLVEKFFNLPTDLSPRAKENTIQRWEEGIPAIPGLLDYLEGKSLDWHNNGRMTHKALLSFALQPDVNILPDKQHNLLESLVKQVNGLDRLVELRHRTIVGHDFEGVSEASLLEASPKNQPPPNMLNEIVQKIEVVENSSHRDNPYEKIARFACQKLRKD